MEIRPSALTGQFGRSLLTLGDWSILANYLNCFLKHFNHRIVFVFVFVFRPIIFIVFLNISTTSPSPWKFSTEGNDPESLHWDLVDNFSKWAGWRGICDCILVFVSSSACKQWIRKKAGQLWGLLGLRYATAVKLVQQEEQIGRLEHTSLFAWWVAYLQNGKKQKTW